MDIKNKIKNYDFYCASGWFSAAQEKSRVEILEALRDLDVTFFSPKDEKICPVEADNGFADTVFRGNIEAIENSRCIIVNTTEKDLGTIFEAGFAYAIHKPIIYYCPGLSGPFNLMLARTAIAVATTKLEVLMHIKNFVEDASYTKEYVGKIE